LEEIKKRTPGSHIRSIYIGIYPEIKTIPLRFASENRNVLKYSRYHTELRTIVEF
jgi:hypothetical protein